MMRAYIRLASLPRVEIAQAATSFEGAVGGRREEVHIEDRNHQLARAYFAAVTAGELPDELLTPDMTGWITTGGTMDKASYQRLVRLLAAMCARPLAFTIDSLT